MKQVQKEKWNNVEEWLPIQEISNGIRLKNQQCIQLLEVEPINFQLLSEREQVAVLESYGRFLKQCDIPLQIVVLPFPAEGKEHLSVVQKYALGNDKRKMLAQHYTQFVNEMLGDKRHIVRRFFLAISIPSQEDDTLSLLIDGLNACGNEVLLCTDAKIAMILQMYWKKSADAEIVQRWEDVYPTYVNTQVPQYLVIDQTYVTSFFVNHYQTEMEGGFLDKILSSDLDVVVSMFYTKRSTYETIKRLTGIIGNTGADIKVSGSNQMDIDLLKGTYENARYIKKQLQVEDDVLFDLNLYFLVYADSVEELNKASRKLESLAMGCGLSARRGIFRQEELFRTCLPIGFHPKELQTISKRNVLASGLVSTYPFLSQELCDKNGVLVGVNALNHSIVMVDRFDSEKYKNANMCVIGASGSGKSYFMKLMIMRNRLLNVEQYIIDPDREYTKICEELDGTLLHIGEENMINVMDIRETILEEGESYLQNKLQKLMTFFRLVFPDLTEEEKSLLEEKTIECYAQKGITFENESLFLGEQKGKLVSKKVFKTSEDMPILGDLYQILAKDKKKNRLSKLLKPYVSGTLQFMNRRTNVNLKNKLVVADLFHIEEKFLSVVLFVITEFYWDKIQENRGRKKMIYLDEVWRLMNRNEDTAQFVFKIFKTIRKYGGAATAVTQDINDFFALENGVYGKGILGNASMKCIFQIEENDVTRLKEVMYLSEMEWDKVLRLERGTCLMHAGRNHLLVKILASPYEHQFISTDRKDL